MKLLRMVVKGAGCRWNREKKVWENRPIKTAWLIWRYVGKFPIGDYFKKG